MPTNDRDRRQPIPKEITEYYLSDGVIKPASYVVLPLYYNERRMMSYDTSPLKLTDMHFILLRRSE
eukprot:12893128-Prorocentrum_lima.AAC.1